jgi:acylphosphatase
LRRHWNVYGQVQGVGYRFFAVQAAQQARLCGYARNLPDGSVQVEAEGGDKEVRAFLDRLRRGPVAARVARIEEHEPTGDRLPCPFSVAY